MTNNKNVTVIGLGAMGAKMAEVYLERGYRVTVWNRTASRADGVVAKGATLAATAKDAVAAGDLVIISQIDYQSMYDSLGEADLSGKTLVNLSSDTPARLRQAVSWVRERGGELVTGGIMTSPPGIGTPGAYVFYSGSQEVLEAHHDTVKELGDVRFVGDDPGLAMLFYQAMFYMYMSALHSFVQASALVGDSELLLPYASETLAELAGDGPLGAFKPLAQQIADGVHPGEENNMLMMAVGMEHVVGASKDAGIDATLPAALKDLFARTVDLGHGADGFASVFETIRSSK